MKLAKTKSRELLDLCIIVIVAGILSIFSISIHTIGKLYNFFKAYIDLPLAEFLINVCFLSLAGLLWLTYVRWKKAAKRQAELENIISSISPDVLLVIDSDRTIIECNDSVKRMFGYEVGEVIGQKTDLLYFDWRSAQSNHDDWQKIHDKFERNGFHIGSATGKKKNGETIPLEIIAASLSGRGGAVQLLRDITERRRADKALRESEEKHRTLVEQSLQGLAVIQDFRIVFANTAVAEITGCSPEELLALTPEQVKSIVHPEDRALAWQRFRDRLAGESVPPRHEYRIVRKDGTIRWLETFATAIEYQGKPALQAAFVDITERKRAEKALQQSEKKYRQLVENMQEGIWLIDKDAYTTFVNPRMSEMLGYSTDEMLGKHLFFFMDEQATEIAKFNLERRKQGIKEQHDFEFVRKDGTLVYTSLETSPITDDDGNYIGALASVADITKRKRAEEALRRAHEELEKRVRERTAELEQANQTLQAEIAERKRAEERLRESEERYKTLVETSNDMIFTVDLKGSFLFINRASERILGYTSEEIKRINGFEPVHPDDLETVREQFAQLVGGKSVDNMEYRYKAKSGSYINIMNNASPILDPNGNVVAALGVARDVTERKRAEEELTKYRDHLEELVEERTAELTEANQQLELEITERKRAEEAVRVSEERLRQIAENVGEGFFLSDASDNSAIYVSPAYEKIWGRPVGTAYADAQSWLEVVHPEDRERVKAYVEKHSRGKIAFSQEYRILWPDGSIRWVRDRVYPVKNESGEIYRIVGVTDDITERKRIEQARRESEERLRSLFETMAEGVILIATDGQIIQANPAAGHILGLERSEIIGRNYVSPEWEVFRPDGTPMPPEEMAGPRAMKEKHPVKDVVMGVQQPDGSISWINVNATPLIDQAGKLQGVVGTFADITERKRSEEDLKKTKQQAEEANRLKSEFLANMSHEIRTPMNAIIGMTDITLETCLTDEQRDYLITVKDSARALLQLLDDILDLSKVEAGRSELETIDFDLRVTVEGVADTLAPKASAKGLELVCMIHHQIPALLRGDPGRLRQILINLGGNAVKFTEKGEVVIRVELEEETENRATLLFSVTDTGVGIPKDKQKEIFEPFIQVDGSTTRKYGGTGLGLSISKRLVKLLGGQIGVESESGKGSRFWFTTTLEKQKEFKDVFPSLPPDIRGMRILVVDDNKTNRTILVKILESFACSAEAVEGRNEAIRILKKAAQKEKLFDLVLLDMQMPEMDGEEVLRAIKDDPEIKDVAVIILTSLGERGDAARLEALGCAGYLLKPVKQSQLFDAIITVMSQQKKEIEPKPGRIVTRHTIAEQKRRKVRILVAEDNPMNQKLAVALLKKAGYPVDAVENGRMVMEALNRTAYHLILMDVQMPEMDGFEATKAIRKMEGVNKHAPIIAMTAHAMKGDRERCLQVGMDDYISKPIEPQELFNVIKKWTKSRDPKNANKWKGEFKKGDQIKEPLLDLKIALTRFDGDKEFFKQMLQKFLDYAPKQLSILDEAAKEGNAKEIEREAHGLKGAAGNLGVKGIADLSLKLELLGRTGNLAGAKEMIGNLKTELKRLEEYLNKSFPEEVVLKS